MSTTMRLVAAVAVCHLLLSVSVTAPLHAESLADAWAISAQVDPRLGASQNKVQAAQCSQAAAEAAYNPSLSNVTAYNFLSDSPSMQVALPGLGALELPLMEQQFVASTTMAKMPLYTGGRISNSVDAAHSQLNATRMQAATTRLDIKLEVAEAYVTVLRLHRQVLVVESNVASLEAHSQDVSNLLNQGLTAKNHLLAAQVALADARQRLLQVRNGQDTAQAAYNRLLGRPMTYQVQLDEMDLPVVSQDLESLIQQALDRRPELAGLACQASALRSQARSVRGETLPQVGLAGGFTYLEDEVLDPEGVWSASVGMQWTPYDGGVSRAKSSSMLHNANALVKLRDDATTAVALQVRKAWLDTQETRQRIEVGRSAIGQAEENLRVSRNRFDQGLGTNTEVLDAETLRTQSHTNYYAAVYDALLASFRLDRAVGSL